MKKRYLKLYFSLFIALSSGTAMAQCEPGEIELSMNLYTDGWGYELYWELVPSGNACGDGTILSGGNADEVGCLGAGQQDATGGNGYDNNATYAIDPICLIEGEFYDLIFIDDYGDGGLMFEVFEDGDLTHLYVGGGSGNTWTFQAGFPTTPDYDQPCAAELIEIDGPSLVLDNTEAIAPIGEITPGGGGCGTFGIWCEGGVTASVWAKFVAPESGAVQISSCNPGTELDTQLALYAFEDCGDYDTYTLITSNDDAFEGCDIANSYASTMYASCLVPGQEYLIQMDGWQGDTGLAELTVTTYTEPITLDAFVNSVDCPNVKGDNSGGITLLAFGTGVDYTASWTGPDGYVGEGIFLDDLVAGDYTVELSTACGETATGTFTVTVPDPISISYTTENATCEDSENGEINLTVGGATEPYTYSWTGPDGFDANSQDVNGVSPGFYSVQIIDDNDCVFNQNVVVDYELDFNFNLGADTTICQNQDIFLTGPGGYNYEWQDGSNNQFFVLSGTEVGPGTYVLILSASNELGCEYTDAIIVTVSVCVGVEEINATALSIYPNPTSGSLTLEGVRPQSSQTLEVFDMSGKLVLNPELPLITSGVINLDVSDLSQGMYILRLLDSEQSRTVRFTVE